MGGAVSGLVDTVGDTLSGGADLYKQIQQPIFNNAGLIGTGVGAAFGQPALGAALGGAIQGKLGEGSSGAQLVGAGLGAYGALQSGQSAQQAAQQQAQAGQFRPVGVTTRFGSSNFQVDPTTGRLLSAGYNLSPEAAGYQTQLSGMTGQGLMQGSQLQGLASQYLGESPEAVRQRYMTQQSALLAPKQEQTLAGIRNNLFQTGRTGLATGATTAGGLAATNPEMAAYYNSLAQQQAQIAAGADVAAQNQIKFGQGLASGAYEPFKAGFGALGTVEQAGQQALGLGSELGGQASSAARAVAPYQYQAAAYNPTANLLANPQLQGALGQGIAGLFGNTSVPSWTTGSDVIPASTFSGSGDASWMSDYWM
jgi:hypothetical protein